MLPLLMLGIIHLEKYYINVVLSAVTVCCVSTVWFYTVLMQTVSGWEPPSPSYRCCISIAVAIRAPELCLTCVLSWPYVLVKSQEAPDFADTSELWSAVLLCQSISTFLRVPSPDSQHPLHPLSLALWQLQRWPDVIWIIYYDAYHIYKVYLAKLQLSSA